MSESLPPCPKCSSHYVYEDQTQCVCPECGYEWNPHEVDETEQELKVSDTNGQPLKEGDKVTLAKDLKVKGTSQTLKVGTKAIIKRIVEGDHDIDCKVDGVGPMMLKSQFVKKA